MKMYEIFVSEEMMFVMSMYRVWLRVIVNTRCVSIFFFFQAEDGIRDAQESRGLGDVYKRQTEGQAGRRLDFLSQEMLREANTMASKAADAEIVPVSYTHLTLPTIYSV